MPNQDIRCRVDSCKFNDHARHCTLGHIDVGAKDEKALSCKDTECASFEKE